MEDADETLQTMREIVSAGEGGKHVSEQILKQFLAAANWDLNVALNHFFNSSPGTPTKTGTELPKPLHN